MSRESLLDEAIVKAKEAEDWQLAEWLRMARGADKAAKWYTAKIRELEDENARLRSCLSDDTENARQIMGENDRLRELVRDMMRFFEDGSYCTTCEKVAECDASEIYECDCLMHSVFKDRMRELGAETEEA